MFNYDYDEYDNCYEECQNADCEQNDKCLKCVKNTLVAMMKRIRSDGCDPEVVESYVEDLCSVLDIDFPRDGILPRKVI
jgi:hypothetical protein